MIKHSGKFFEPRKEYRPYETKKMVFIPTHDDWHPSYKNEENQMFIALSLIKLFDNVTYRICVWGRDDFGLELDTTDAAQAEELFKFFKAQDYLNIDDFFSRRNCCSYYR